MSADHGTAMAAKLAKVQEAVQDIERRGTGDGYQSAQVAEVFAAAREQFAAESLAILPSIEETTDERVRTVTADGEVVRNASGGRVRVRMTIRIVDSETGYAIEPSWEGDGDTLSSATTNCLKDYLITGLFLLPATTPTGNDRQQGRTAPPAPTEPREPTGDLPVTDAQISGYIETARVRAGVTLDELAVLLVNDFDVPNGDVRKLKRNQASRLVAGLAHLGANKKEEERCQA